MVVLSISFFILFVILYYALLDRYTPFTSEAFIQAYVNQVAPEVDGRVTAIRVEDNQLVSAGDTLFELDDRPYADITNQLEAELVLARKEVELLQSDLEAATDLIAQVQADLILAQQEFKRFSESADRGASPMIQLDEATDRLSVKRALLREVQARKDKAEASLAAVLGKDNALVAKAQAKLNHARYNLEQTKVVAATNGYVTNLQLTVGTFVSAGQQVMTLVDADNWWIVAHVRENSLPLMKPGQSAQVTTALYPGRIFDAVVHSVGWGVSEGQGIPSGELPDITGPKDWVKVSQRFPVRLHLQSPEDHIDMRIGGSVTVVVYSTDSIILNVLASLWLKIASILNFVY